MEPSSQNALGQVQSSVDWLETHHRAKFLDRRNLIENLGILPGSKVLDVACGPGHFTRLLAKTAGPNGHVLAFDHDETSIKKGMQMRIPNADFVLADFHDPAWLAELAAMDFDVVIGFNHLMYGEDVETEIATLASIIHRDARLIVKDSDFAHMFTNICDESDFIKLIEANKSASCAPLDNFIGKSLFSYPQFGAAQVTRRFTWPYLMQSPFTEDQIFYLVENIRILVSNVRQTDAEATGRRVQRDFSENRLKRADERDALFFLMHDFVVEVTGARP